MNEPSRNRWRGISADDRVAERRARLVDVAFDLMGTDGMAGTSVRRVCEMARLNPRYFYESFPDLDHLVVAVFDRTATEAAMAIAASAAAASGGGDPEVMTRATIAGAMRFVTEDPRRARVLFTEGFGNEALARRRFDTLGELADLLVADARKEAEERTGQPVELGSLVLVAANLVMGGFAELLLAWLDGRLDVSIEDLIDDATDLFLALASSVDVIEAKRAAARAATSPDDAPG